MRKAKNLVQAGIQLSIANNLVGFVTNFVDLGLTSNGVHQKFAFNN